MRLISGVMQSILPPGMRATTSLRPSCTPWVLGLLLLAFTGCKADGTKAPEAQLDNIAAIESELAANQARLESQGVVLTPPATPVEDQVVTDDEGGDATSPEPAVSPPPEPEPEPAPAPDPTDAPTLASEEADDEAPELESARSRDYRSSRKERKKSRRSANRDERTRCERICDLSDNTCDLADKICALADEHVDDVRYEDACDRAEAQCEAATDACTNCED